MAFVPNMDNNLYTYIGSLKSTYRHTVPTELMLMRSIQELRDPTCAG